MLFIPLQVEDSFEFHFCCWTTTKIKALVHTIWFHRCHTIRIYLKTPPTPEIPHCCVAQAGLKLPQLPVLWLEAITTLVGRFFFFVCNIFN